MPKRLNDKELQAFNKELEDFRARYPMCYIESWTPVDFAGEVLDEEGEKVLRPALKWNDPKCEYIAEALANNFDAQYGTNWTRIEFAQEGILNPTGV